MARSNSRRNLMLRGKTWWFQRYVDPRFAARFKDFPGYDDRRYVRCSLRTSDLKVAIRKRDQLNVAMDQVFSLDVSDAADRYEVAVDAARNAVVERNGNHVHDSAEAGLSAMLDDIEFLGGGLHSFAQLEEHDQVRTLEGLEIDPVEFFALRDVKMGDRQFKRPTFASYTVRKGAEDRCQLLVERGYRDHVRSIVGKTRTSAQRWLEWRGRDEPLDSIRRPTVRRWVDQMLAEGLAPATVRDRIGYLKQIFATAQDYGRVDESLRNPFESHKIVVERRLEGVGRVAMPDSILWAAMQKLHADDWFPVLLSRYTGCRLSEAILLRPEDVEDVEGHLSVKIANLDDRGRPTGKTASSTRLVPVHSDLCSTLKEWANGDIPSHWSRRQDAKDPASAFSKRFGRAIREITPDRRIVFHSIRHAVSTWLQQQWPLEDASLITGHADVGSRSEARRTYFHGHRIERLAEMVESLPQFREWISTR